MRFDSRVDGLEELVEDTLTPHDAQLIRRHPERGPDGLGGVEKELEDEEDDALLEEVSQGRLGAAAAGEKHWDQRYGGDEERLELQAVSDLLAEASRESSAPDLARTESRTNQLLAELSEDSFLRKGAQIPGVEQAVWEGMGGTRSGLPPPPRGIGVGPYAHRQARRSDGAESAASDWDERGFEPMRKTTEADLVAEGAALLHERSGEV